MAPKSSRALGAEPQGSGSSGFGALGLGFKFFLFFYFFFGGGRIAESYNFELSQLFGLRV